MAELLKATIEGDNQLTNGFTYVIILGFIAGISFWLYRMNSALKMFEGLIIIPLLQVFWTTCAILQGGMYFQEFEKFTVSQIMGFSTGVLIVFIGVYMLAPLDQEALLDDCFEVDVNSSMHLNHSLHPIGPASTSVAIDRKSRRSSRSGTGNPSIANAAELEGVASTLANSVSKAGNQLSTLASRVMHGKSGTRLYEIAMDTSRNQDNFSRADTAMDVSNRSDISELSAVSSSSSQFINPLQASSPGRKGGRGVNFTKKAISKIEI